MKTIFVKKTSTTLLSHSEFLQLKRWNTPLVYNGWEAITKHDRLTCWNLEETRDFMPLMGSMVGYAVTVMIELSNPGHPKNNPIAWKEYRTYVASVAGLKIVVIQDLDKPKVIGSFWGEVSGNVQRALGCVGTIVDGAIRDVDEMCNAGFKELARRLDPLPGNVDGRQLRYHAPGHAAGHPPDGARLDRSGIDDLPSLSPERYTEGDRDHGLAGAQQGRY
ncbi:MAG: hypothetical protein JSV89_19190 [Spirochaetaceae bacterium]|nr:MAG: hypothetical protein JSV89_19190 [Spirochaetaceae bacterium]